MNEDTHWRYGLMYDGVRPIHGRVSRRMADDSVIMPMRNFMGLVTIIAYYANMIDVAGYSDYRRVDMGADKYRAVKVVAKQDFHVADAYINNDPCLPYGIAWDKTIKSYRHNFTLWIGSDLDGTYSVYIAVCDTTIHDINSGREYENVLYYSGVGHEHWSNFL